MNHNKFSLKCSNEFGMVSVIDFSDLKTDVSFGFSPDSVTFSEASRQQMNFNKI